MAKAQNLLLADGLYESPITHALQEALRGLPPRRAERAPLSSDTAPLALARMLQERILHAFKSLPAESQLEHQIKLANDLLTLLRRVAPEGGALAEDGLVIPAELLLAIHPAPDGSLATGATQAERPLTPLTVSDLLINARNDLSVGPELQRELASADRVDLVCSFVKWHGFRILADALRNFMSRCPGCLRVLTTTYIGATERRAVDALAALGAQVKISYDTSQTRLHAKAWLFHRRSGFSTAYIGSSNLSASALLDGLEWNVRLSMSENERIIRKFTAAFEQYWSDSAFEPYQRERDAERLDAAIKRERTGAGVDHDALSAFIEITPRPHQQEILDELSAERSRGHYRNLVVAATGTGKTVIAALDYQRLSEELGSGGKRPSLLFVAHRDELLRQSQQTFQHVLQDSSFGERLVGGDTPRAGTHVFASIQSLNEQRIAGLAPDAYEVVIVDEFHHAAAPTYDRLLSVLRPRVLLGLTATPERADEKPILHHFDFRIASELRLWKALDQGLLAPFQYFAAEGPDVSRVAWKRGRYDISELSNVYTANDAFAHRVIREVIDKIADPNKMRALGFCVDIAHAEFMTDRFRRAGFAAAYVSGRASSEERRASLQKLVAGEIRVLFNVELFNEGIDIPSVDTLLFLRPTESATLFLQQLGRGLRRDRAKPCCTVLDFIGGAHRKFRFDLRFRAIVGGTRRQVQRQVEHGFPSLPSGCSIVLSRTARDAVLRNVKHQLGLGQRGLVEDLRQIGERATLPKFLAETGFELEDVYDKSGSCFSRLRRSAGFSHQPVSQHRAQVERALARMLHIDDDRRLEAFREILSASLPPTPSADDPIQRMLFALLSSKSEPLSAMARTWSLLWAEDDLRLEIVMLLERLAERTRRLVHPVPAELSTLPFSVHATYTQQEVFAGLNELSSKGGIFKSQQGVHYFDRYSCDCFFVTLDKNEKDYTPTTLYNDYPLSPTTFHWESQSNCHEETTNGRRYLEIRRGGAQHAFLFVRHRKRDERGITTPYLLLGRVFYKRHSGGRPMQIEWELEHPMPARDYQEMKIAAG